MLIGLSVMHKTALERQDLSFTYLAHHEMATDLQSAIDVTETIWAADCRLPKKAYLALLDQPAVIIP